MLEKINEKSYSFSMVYCDAHTHLQDIKDLPAAMVRAKECGVAEFICNATHEADWQKVIDISRKYPNVSVVVGVHPWFLHTLTDGWDERLEQILKDNPAFMVGEIGLDKVRADNDPHVFGLDNQERVMRIQLDLAAKYNRPFHMHCVRAWDRILHILKTNKRPPVFVSHSHHGNAGLIPDMVEMGAYFSYSAVFLPENRIKVRKCVQETPIDRILVESDAPDLVTEPAGVSELVSAMAVLRKEDPTALTKHIYRNFKELIHGRSI